MREQSGAEMGLGLERLPPAIPSVGPGQELFNLANCRWVSIPQAAPERERDQRRGSKRGECEKVSQGESLCAKGCTCVCER